MKSEGEMWCGEYGNKMNMFTFMSFNYILCVQFPLLFYCIHYKQDRKVIEWQLLKYIEYAYYSK